MPETPHIVSASQIETFLLCRRKWGWKTIARIPAPQHPSAAKGSRTHKQLENYLRDGVAFQYADDAGRVDETGYIAAAIAEYLPPPKTPGIDFEGNFSFASRETGNLFRGYQDVRGPSSLVFPALAHLPDAPVISDHKTTAGLHWAKTSDDLLYDPQAVIYAYEAMGRYKSPTVHLQWTYGTTRKPFRALPVVQTMTSAHVVPVFRAIDRLATEMASTLFYTAPDRVNDLPANPAVCEMYGGCPYRHLCQLTDQERFSAAMTSAQPSATDALIAQLRGSPLPAPVQPPPPAPPAPAARPAIAPPNAGEDLLTWAARMQLPLPDALAALGALMSQAPAPAPAAPPPPAPVQVVTPTSTVTYSAEYLAQPMTPPPPAAAPPVQVPAAINPPESVQSPPITAIDRAPVTPQVPAAVEPPKARGPGRPPGSKNKTKDDAPAGPVKAISVLYVDCLPDSGDLVYAAVLADAANQRVCATENVANYRYVDYTKGLGALVAIVNSVLDSPDWGHKAVALESRTPEGAALLSSLIARSDRVVRGF